ncbi:MAG: 1,4-dihydroxy-6-naphthoate synthase, partial [Pseudohongiellaceae bacterium]
TAVFSESLAIARADVPSTLPTMRKWAQELDDDVLLKHVELYVNDSTTDLGSAGRRCLAELARRSGRGAAPVVLG